ncbi:hypothetical protein PP914_gp032 [Arthrobacter phage Qui]|uniref:Uncharacterized protein n=1 Tax=Arthrobacter phage Qui TaxID=2603260 RepID=A0A5B8WLP9_9CAUD|nr:hypothetical protein PP914_gp032 [Arthrobacter phage Qui]QED11522.1 hypothetical protein SEA_QUI_32 [Arthrobacter phage Qui]QOC56354.1 hypothetical protein SEA_PAELLA_32 [Arthrobacter phage Paella]
MLTLIIPPNEAYDERANEFIKSPEVELELEHSLVSLSKWEAIWEKPFLGTEAKSAEETMSYVHCMTLTPDIPPEITQRLTNDHLTQINKYIDAKMSATWFNERATQGRPKSREIITSELIYYWMIAHTIPFECQYWHLNRLFTLIKVCNAKNAPEKKMSKNEMLAQRNKLNAQRKAELKTSG